MPSPPAVVQKCLPGSLGKCRILLDHGDIGRHAGIVRPQATQLDVPAEGFHHLFDRSPVQPTELHPDRTPLRAVEKVGQLEGHFGPAHEHAQVIGADGVVPEHVEFAGIRVVAEHRFQCREEPVRRLGQALYPGQDLVAPARVTGPLPFGHPVADQGQPVRPDARPGARWMIGGVLALGHGDPHRVEVQQGAVHVDHIAHQVTRPFVGSQIMVVAAQWGLADAQFLGAAAPVPHVVTRTQSDETSQVIHIHLPGVPAHGLCHAEDISPATAQKTVPQPHIGHQLGVVPGEAADVVAPHVARRVVRVHHVAVVPKTVPVALLHLFLVKRKGAVELVLYPALARSGTIGQTPHPQSLHRVQILRRTHQQRRLLTHPNLLDCLFPGWNPNAGEQGQFAGAANAVRRAETRLHILIAGIQIVIPGVVVAQIHRRSIRRPQPGAQFGPLGGRIEDLQGRGERLPEILHAYAQPAGDIADKGQPRSSLSGTRFQPAALRVGALVDHKPVGRGLHQLEVAPHGPVRQQLLAGLVERFAVGQPPASKLTLIRDIITAPPPFRRLLPGQRQDAPSGQRLNRLGPQPRVLTRKTDVAVVHLLAHGHREDQPQTADEIRLLISIKDDRVHQPHRRLARVEVHTYGERQPFPAPLFRLVHALELDHRAHRTGLLHFDALDTTDELLPRRSLIHIAVRPRLQDADQTSLCGDLAPVDRQ